jgi:hypothetical protein
MAWLAYAWARYGVYSRLAYAGLAYANQIDLRDALGGFIYAASLGLQVIFAFCSKSRC